MEATMQTDTSAPQSHSLIASDRVEGTPVRRSSGEKIGTIERLMIDKLSGNVAYAVLSFGGFLGMGQKHVPIACAAELLEQGLTIAAADGARQRGQIFVEASEHFQHCLLVSKKNVAPHRRIRSRDAGEVAEATGRELQHL